MMAVAGQGVTRMELEPNLAVVASARRFVRETLAEMPMPVVDDVQLIASELITNAIEHGPGGPVTVEIDHQDTAVELTVRSPNPSGDIDRLEQSLAPSVDATSGRGLRIVRHVADWVEIKRTAGFLTVVALRRI